jgi:hypothetical protein
MVARGGAVMSELTGFRRRVCIGSAVSPLLHGVPLASNRRMISEIIFVNWNG